MSGERAEKRYQTIRDTANDLEELLEEMTGVSDIERSWRLPRTRPQAAREHRRRRSPGEHCVSYLPFRIERRIHSLRSQTTQTCRRPCCPGANWRRRLALYLRAQTTQVAIESIAVMPFVNESGNADVEYLSDGMTETLISSLSQLANLNVRPRSSVFRYKGKRRIRRPSAKN